MITRSTVPSCMWGRLAASCGTRHPGVLLKLRISCLRRAAEGFHCRLSCNAVQSSASLPEGTELPLCERPPASIALLQAVLDWRQDAFHDIAAVATSWVQADDPSQEDLQTELDWLLDDAVADWQEDCSSTKWAQTTWKQLQRQWWQLEEAQASAPGCVRLRASLHQLQNLWQQRLRGRVPLQYLTNTVHWRELILAVGPGVLIPRPETELLIDFAQQALRNSPELRAHPWMDLGTGSGAIALGLATLLPASTPILAVEASPDAALWAQLNIQRLHCQEQVQVLQGSWFEPARHLRGQLGGVVSNPPYIPEAQMATLQAEVAYHEPTMALSGGHGMGLASLSPICSGAADMLRPGGFLALETAGGEQSHFLAKQLQSQLAGDARAFSQVEVTQDHRGIERFVTALKAV